VIAAEGEVMAAVKVQSALNVGTNCGDPSAPNRGPFRTLKIAVLPVVETSQERRKRGCGNGASGSDCYGAARVVAAPEVAVAIDGEQVRFAGSGAKIPDRG
jgi:hypothetical protein